MKIVIAGGGTAGHVYPGISIADELSLEVPDCEIVFVGNASGIEAELIPEAGYSFHPIDVKGLRRSLSLGNAAALLKASSAVRQLRHLFNKMMPEAVVGTGGYVSAPAVFAAYTQKIPTLIHEQNAFPGMANKILSRLVDTVATSFPNGEESFPKAKLVAFTGNPIRRKMIGAVRENAAEKFNLETDKKTLLLFGGSQGAQKINEAFIKSYDKFKSYEDLQVIHITGKDHFTDICKRMRRLIDADKDKLRYQAHPYMSNINQAYAAADLCLCRAGATSVAEITALGVPSVLVPYPHATGNHQEKNARYLEKNGATTILTDEELTGQSIFDVCSKLLYDDKALIDMKNNAQKIGKPYAANDIAKLVNGLGHKLKI